MLLLFLVFSPHSAFTLTYYGLYAAFTAQGYAVLLVNYRGSLAYGQVWHATLHYADIVLAPLLIFFSTNPPTPTHWQIFISGLFSFFFSFFTYFYFGLCSFVEHVRVSPWQSRHPGIDIKFGINYSAFLQGCAFSFLFLSFFFMESTKLSDTLPFRMLTIVMMLFRTFLPKAWQVPTRFFKSF